MAASRLGGAAGPAAGIPGQAADLLAADAGVIPAVPADGKRKQTCEDTCRKYPQLKIKQLAERNPGEG